MPKTDKPAKGRRNVPLYVMLPPDERDRVAAFATKVDRTLSWTVRDALTVYLDAVEPTAAKLHRTMNAPTVDAGDAGKTKQPRRGRPSGYGAARIKPLAGTDEAALQAALDGKPKRKKGVNVR